MALFDNSYNLPPFQIHIYRYKKYTGLINMAIDHYMASNTDKFNFPLIRFYGWKPFCLSIGYHQDYKIINKEILASDGYHIVKRPTGGRAIFHAEELTYSAIFPKNFINHKKLYIYIHVLFTKILKQMGYDVDFTGNNPKLPYIKQSPDDFPCFTKAAESEVEYYGKKLIGSAQKIYPNSTLQHGSILIGDKHKELVKYFKTSVQQKEKIANEMKEKTICLNEIKKTNISASDIQNQFINRLESGNKNSVIFKQLEQEIINKSLELYYKDFSL